MSLYDTSFQTMTPFIFTSLRTNTNTKHCTSSSQSTTIMLCQKQYTTT